MNFCTLANLPPPQSGQTEENQRTKIYDSTSNECIFFNIIHSNNTEKKSITKNFELSVQPANKRQSEEMKMKLFFSIFLSFARIFRLSNCTIKVFLSTKRRSIHREHTFQRKSLLRPQTHIALGGKNMNLHSRNYLR